MTFPVRYAGKACCAVLAHAQHPVRQEVVSDGVWGSHTTSTTAVLSAFAFVWLSFSGPIHICWMHVGSCTCMSMNMTSTLQYWRYGTYSLKYYRGDRVLVRCWRRSAVDFCFVLLLGCTVTTRTPPSGGFIQVLLISLGEVHDGHVLFVCMLPTYIVELRWCIGSRVLFSRAGTMSVLLRYSDDFDIQIEQFTAAVVSTGRRPYLVGMVAVFISIVNG